jgi:hypothetical protein
MAAKLIRITHKIAIQVHLVAESCTTRSSRMRTASPETLIHPRTLTYFKIIVCHMFSHLSGSSIKSPVIASRSRSYISVTSINDILFVT